MGVCDLDRNICATGLRITEAVHLKPCDIDSKRKAIYQRFVGEFDDFVGKLGSTTNPRQALIQLQRSRPDVLFLVNEMPGMSGFELLEQLGTPQPLVVFTTAYDQYALNAFRVNSIDYLLKPVDGDQH